MTRNPQPRADEEPSVDRVLVGLALFGVLFIALAIVQKHHFDSITLSSVVGVAGAAGPWKTMWQKLPTNLAKRMATRLSALWASTLAATGTRWTLGALIAGTALGQFTLASVHIDAPAAPEQSVVLYRYEESADASGAPIFVDSVKLDVKHSHRIRPVWNALSRRRVWFATSRFERTAAYDRGSWSKVELLYPQDFRPLIGVAILPMEKLLAAIGRDQPLTVEVADAQGIALAGDTLRDPHSMPALMIGFVPPPPPDTVARRRWTDLLRESVAPAMAQEDLDGVVGNWMKRHPLRTTRDLKPGERVRVTIRRSSGVVLAETWVTLGPAFTEAILAPRT